MLTPEQRLALVRLYYAHGNSPTAALRAYGRETGNYVMICKPDTVKDLVKKFERTQSVKDAPRSGRPKISDDTVRNVATAAAGIGAQSSYGECSISSIANVTRVPQSTVRKILKKNLKWKPYRIQEVHKLENGDPERRRLFAEQFLAINEADPQWLPRVIFGDEAIFSLCGQVNSWNTRIWASENPHAIHEKPLHSEKVMVWLGFSADFILRPYFYREPDENGVARSVTVNGPRYLEMLEDYVIPTLAEMEVLDDAVWMQDGAPAHRTNAVTDLLRAEFGEDRVIGLRFPFAWPARSPDLTPCDFFLWGHLKSLVYQHPPANMAELIHSIAESVRSITPDQLRSAVYHMITRMNLVVDQNGGHIEQLLHR